MRSGSFFHRCPVVPPEPITTMFTSIASIHMITISITIITINMIIMIIIIIIICIITISVIITITSITITIVITTIIIIIITQTEEVGQGGQQKDGVSAPRAYYPMICYASIPLYVMLILSSREREMYVYTYADIHTPDTLCLNMMSNHMSSQPSRRGG